MKTLPSDGVSANIENLDSLNDEALARLAQNGSCVAEHNEVIFMTSRCTTGLSLLTDIALMKVGSVPQQPPRTATPDS